MFAASTASTRIDPKSRILLKGGTIVSMDAKVGDLVKGDLLIEGTKISAIAPEINAADAQVIDAADTIIVPGPGRLPSAFLGRRSFAASIRIRRRLRTI